MGAWVWGQCSKTCGLGSQTGTRNVNATAMHGGSCTHERATARKCNKGPCTGVYKMRLDT